MKAATDIRAAYRALACPRYELLPTRGVIEQAGLMPRGATATVTCSPRLGLDRTIDTAGVLHGMGFVAVPHLAARLVRDQRHLRQILDRLAGNGIQEIFVIGGDVRRPVGEFTSSAQLLTAMDGLSVRPQSIGIPAYPEGHALIDRQTLEESLRAKSGFVDYMVTQLCFDPKPILAWVTGIRGQGVRLPAYIGIPGVVSRRRLLAIALRIGAGDSTRMLRRHGPLIGQLLHSEAYAPDGLAGAILPAIGTGETGIIGFHINTFNNVEPTVRWQLAMIEKLRQRRPAAEQSVLKRFPAR